MSGFLLEIRRFVVSVPPTLKGWGVRLRPWLSDDDPHAWLSSGISVISREILASLKRPSSLIAALWWSAEDIGLAAARIWWANRSRFR